VSVEKPGRYDTVLLDGEDEIGRQPLPMGLRKYFGTGVREGTSPPSSNNPGGARGRMPGLMAYAALPATRQAFSDAVYRSSRQTSEAALMDRCLTPTEAAAEGQEPR